MEYPDVGGEFGERWWKDIIIGVGLSKDEMLEGDRKSWLPNMGGKHIEAGWVASFCNIVE